MKDSGRARCHATASGRQVAATGLSVLECSEQRKEIGWGQTSACPLRSHKRSHGCSPTQSPVPGVRLLRFRSIADSGHPLVRGGSAHFTAPAAADGAVVADSRHEHRVSRDSGALCDGDVARRGPGLYRLRRTRAPTLDRAARRSGEALCASVHVRDVARLRALRLPASPSMRSLRRQSRLDAAAGAHRCCFSCLLPATGLVRIQLLVLALAYVLATFVVGARTRSVRRSSRPEAFTCGPPKREASFKDACPSGSVLPNGS